VFFFLHKTNTNISTNQALTLTPSVIVKHILETLSNFKSLQQLLGRTDSKKILLLLFNWTYLTSYYTFIKHLGLQQLPHWDLTGKLTRKHLNSHHIQREENLKEIIEWLGLEGTSRIMKLQPPCHRHGHQPPHLILHQAAQSPIQPGLEHLQGRGIHSPSGQPVPAPHHSHSKELPPDIQRKSSLLQLKTRKGDLFSVKQHVFYLFGFFFFWLIVFIFIFTLLTFVYLYHGVGILTRTLNNCIYTIPQSGFCGPVPLTPPVIITERRSEKVN